MHITGLPGLGCLLHHSGDGFGKDCIMGSH